MKLRTLITLVLTLALLAAATWGGLKLYARVNAPTAVELPAAKVKRSPVMITVTARGELQGGNSEMLSAPMTGSDTLVVTELREPGEVVKEGDVVVQFDITQQEYNLREAEADLAEAEQKVVQAEADSESSDEESRYAVDAAENAVQLAALEIRRNPTVSAITARQNDLALEAAQNRLRQAKQDLTNKKTTASAAINIQKANENKARVMATTAKKNIENMTLKAKSAGYVNIQSNTFGMNMIYMGMMLPTVQLGDTVRPGMAIAQIPDVKSWEIAARVAELDRGHLAVNQKVLVSLVALPGKSFPGHVKTLGGTTGPTWDRRFECRIELDQPAPEMRPGMTSNFVITAETLKDVTWIPSQALFESDGRTFVYLKTPKGYMPHDVALVKRSESQAIVTGVSEGETVSMSNPDEAAKAAPAQQQGAMKALQK
jgi:multidrug efflux pump subunit AcrA (membrane-fusion protein)